MATGEFEYQTIDNLSEKDDKGRYKKRLKNVAHNNAELHSLINDINEYLDSCKGSATFEIIQNKTERRITKLYDLATSKASFPTHYGLMGTFVGVFIGLSTFLAGSFINGGITDGGINSLILGVLVSMSTSFIGLRMSTKANDRISNAKKKIDEDKNTFYEYIQNKLMPSVDVSLTEALGKLHETVSEFEPSFSSVIKGFKTTFEACTKAFGDEFRVSVTKMVGAVTDMGQNIGIIKQNTQLLESLLNKLTNSEWIAYMGQFSDATEHFKKATQSLNDFERARRMMLAAAQEAINVQKTYNDSLQIPRQIAMEVNGILQRVVTFEKSINSLGETIAQTQMLGNTEIEEIKQQINAIKAKHKVAEQYIETSNNKLEMFFDSQLIELKRLEGKYVQALEDLFAEYEKQTKAHEDSIKQRNDSFKNAIEEKFELSGVRSELAELKKLPNIERKVEDVKKGQEKLQSTNEGIRKEINALNEIKEEENKSLFEKLTNSGSNSAQSREIERLEKENEDLKKAQKEREQAELERLKALGLQAQEDDRKLQEILAAKEERYKNSSGEPKTEQKISNVGDEEDVSDSTIEEKTNFFGRLKNMILKK